MIQPHNFRERAAGSGFRPGAPKKVPVPFALLDDPRNAPCPRPGRSFFALKEASMFEGQPQSELDALFKANPEFRQLYHHHKELDKKVLDAELGVLPMDDSTLLQMKREKLAAKDRLSRLFETLQN
jgi:uncharacterized protein YdcH (DUF465 family)